MKFHFSAPIGLLVVGLFAAFSASAQAPRLLCGTVVAMPDGLPIAAAVVIEPGTGNIAFTDENGWFTILLDRENPSIEVDFTGMVPQTVVVGPQTEPVRIDLVAEPKRSRKDRKRFAFRY